MTFFLYSHYGDALPLGIALQKAGADVVMHTVDEGTEHVGEGLIDLSEHPNPPAGSIVIFDDTGMGAEGTDLRNQGFAVIGGNPFDTKLGKDRRRGKEIMKEAGIVVPQGKSFKTIDEAKVYVTDKEGKWFVKVDGDLGNASTVDGDSETLKRYLTWVSAQDKQVHGVELQSALQGPEVSVEGWFDGEEFVFPFNATIEEKRLMAGNVGPRTGCESCVVWPYSGPLADELLKMTDVLRKEEYIGSLDLNMIVTQDGPVGLEWTARLGFDASTALWVLAGPTLPEQLEAFAYGALPAWELSPEPALTLRLSIPPYPTEDKKLGRKMYGYPIDSGMSQETIYPTDIRLGPSGLECAGRDGLLGCIVTQGNDMKSKAVDIAGSLKIPSLQYRIDPVSRYEKTLKELDALGVL